MHSSSQRKILIVTVGGSCAPIVNCIGNPPRYDFVYFICSTGRGEASSEIQVDGQGKPCKAQDKEDPSIVAQTGLKREAYEKVTFDASTEIDDISILYAKLKEFSRELQDKFPGVKVTANYTGGTKSMSAALVLIAIECEWELQFNVGRRQNVKQITTGDVPVPIATDTIQTDRNLRLYEEAFKTYNYEMARTVAYDTLSSYNLTTTQRNEWIELMNLAVGFNKWDSFFYGEAWDTLRLVGQRASGFLPFLKPLLPDQAASKFPVVLDLLLNAQRRCAQGRYDDGTARLYRALELFAQARLMEHYGLSTGALDIQDDKIPVEFKEKFCHQVDEDGKFQVGLTNAYELLLALGDPVGSLYEKRRSRILNHLKIRNHSFLAHGFEPIGREGFNEMYGVVHSFIKESIEEGGIKLRWPPQLPDSLP